MVAKHDKPPWVLSHVKVLLHLDVDGLDATDVGALAGDRIGLADFGERFVELTELLVDGAEQRLVASSAKIAIPLVLGLRSAPPGALACCLKESSRAPAWALAREGGCGKG